MITTSLKLSRRITTETFECIATIRRKGSRPDIAAIMELIKQYHKITPEIVLEHMLPHKPIAMANNLLSRYRALGFLDEEGNPGQYANYAFEGEILLPETGKFQITTVKDPIILQYIVRIAYPSKQLFENGNRRTQNRNDNEVATKPIPVPTDLLEVVNRKFIAWFDGRKNVVLESVERMGIPFNEMRQMSLELTLDQNNARIFLRDSEEKDVLNVADTPPIELDSVWKYVLQYAPLTGWRGGPLNRGKLKVSFTETTKHERETFTRRIECPTLLVNGIGEFTAEPFDVAIEPKTKAEADKWATYLVLSQIHDYISDQELAKLVNATKMKFKTFEPSIAERKELIESIQEYFADSQIEADRKHWYLQVPLDLTEVN